MLQDNESIIRAIVFISVLTIFAVTEYLCPGRPLQFKKALRWRNNFLLLGCYTVVLRALLPVALTGFAAFWQNTQWGVLSRISPQWMAVVLGIAWMDFVIYWQHRFMHKWPLLWSIHRIHHSDADIDVSTAVRFHPLEIVVSLAVKLMAIMALGVPPVAVFLFEILLSSFALFNHSNLMLPNKVDHCCRKFFVTPNMHRIHHSQNWQDHNHNFGFALSCWDRLFSSYVEKSQCGDGNFAVGLPEWTRIGFDFNVSEKLVNLFKITLKKSGE
ncbi:hypothetical protein TDB9533_02934 [Thalassocella blandensis]|nr:hypothetical protein TDB9533_02934 [Thalassocella blandensis]